MKKALYQSMYNKIQLEETQKREILEELGKYGEHCKKRRKLPIYAAACLCAVLMSNAAVFAAVHFNLGEKIGLELNHFFEAEQNLTKEQSEIYEQQSAGLEQEIRMEHGTLQLESILCDNSYLFIPFTFCPDEPEKENIRCLRDELNKLDFTVKNTEESSFSSWIWQIDPSRQQEDGNIHGAFMLIDFFRQNDMIQVSQKDDWSQPQPGKPVCELTVSKTAISRNVPFSAKEVNEKVGAAVKQITLSSLSLQIAGTYRNNDPDFLCESYVELKDGTHVKTASNGGFRFSSDGDIGEKNISDFEMSQVFETPVVLDTVKGIHLKTKDAAEYWIPVNAESQAETKTGNISDNLLHFKY